MNKEQLKLEVLESPFCYESEPQLSDSTTFGVEIEFEDITLDRMSESISDIPNFTGRYWDIKEEGTVTTSIPHPLIDEEARLYVGGEIVSPILDGNFFDWLELKSICESISKEKGIVSERCGGHIHYGFQILGENPKSYDNLIKMWAAFEDVISVFCSGDREKIRTYHQQHAPYIGAIVKRENRNVDKMAMKSLDDILIIYGVDRPTDRKALNFSNIRTDDRGTISGTIEVRLPNGTINPVVWQNNVLFFDALINKAKKISKKESSFINGILNDRTLPMEVFEKFLLLLNFLELPEIYKMKMIRQFLYFGRDLTPNFRDFHENLSENIRKRV